MRLLPPFGWVSGWVEDEKLERKGGRGGYSDINPEEDTTMGETVFAFSVDEFEDALCAR